MPEVKKGTACAWGVGTATTPSFGRVINHTHRKTAQKTQLLNQDGDIATKIYHGVENIIDAEILVTATTYTTPNIGDTIATSDSLGDSENPYYHVDEVSAVQTVGDAARINLTLSEAPDVDE